LPASCYLNKGDDSAASHKPSNPELFQSNSDVWDELGVMVPFLDMLNHEVDAHQVTWQPAVVNSSDVKIESDLESEKEHDPRAICHKRVKKGSELYCNYGPKSNHSLILQYGFGLINNSADEVKVGWGLGDAVGNMDTPGDYKIPFGEDEKVDKVENKKEIEDEGKEKIRETDDDITKVYESTDAQHLTNWWTISRVKVLEHEALLSDSVLSMLRAGKKMISVAYHDGRYHPGLLSTAVVATLESERIESLVSREGIEEKREEPDISITKSHQNALQRYLIFFFTRKMEKMLQSLNNGLKGHFDNVNLWVKLIESGLSYYSKEDEAKDGWNNFFETKVYSSSIQVEKNYFTLSPESCVLALYDGHLRSLQTSINSLIDKTKFGEVLNQLEDIGYKVLDSDELPPEEALKKNVVIKEESEQQVETAITEEDTATKEKPKETSSKEEEKKSNEKNTEESNGKAKEKSKSKRSNRKPKKKRGNGANSMPMMRYDRPPPHDRPRAIKLHIGNLAYCTLASDLFEYFAARYGRENVLECHIPTERDSGRSRGFGFVTMTYGASHQALQVGRDHNVHGRMLKIAESNSAGSANRNRGPGINSVVANDRCGRCGYRPRYCVCPVPDIPAFNGAAGRPPFHDDMLGPFRGRPGPRPDFDPPGRGNPELDHYGGSYRRERAREVYSNSPMRHRMGGGFHREMEYDSYQGDYNRHHLNRSHSYSPRREGERSRRRSRERERGGRHRERDRTRGRDRRRLENRERSSHHSRSASQSVCSGRSSSSHSPKRERDRNQERHNKEGKSDAAGQESSSREQERNGSNDSPPGSPSSERKRNRDSRKRSRSRSRERRARRKRSSKKGKKET